MDGKECIGKCVREPFFDQVDLAEKIGMSTWDNEKGKFLDDTISMEE